MCELHQHFFVGRIAGFRALNGWNLHLFKEQRAQLFGGVDINGITRTRINRFLQFIGIGHLQLINTDGAVILGMVYNFLPFMIIPIYTVMEKTDHRLIEAAQDLGCGKWQVIRRVTLPLSIPGIVSGITMVFVPAASTFVISKMLGGGKMMIGDIIEMQIVGGANNLNLGAALSLVLMIFVIITMMFMNRFGDTESEVSLV